MDQEDTTEDTSATEDLNNTKEDTSNAKENSNNAKECKRIMILDTETTGIPKRINGYFDLYKNLKSYDNSRLIELAYVIYDSPSSSSGANNSVNREEFQSLIIPEGFTINANMTKIHGITEEMCNETGKSLSDVLQKLHNDINTVDIIVGHNVEFDVSIILAEYYRLHGKCIFTDKKQREFVCTVNMYHDIYGKYYKLCDLYKLVFKEEPEGNAHRAMNDVLTCERLYSWGGGRSSPQKINK